MTPEHADTTASQHQELLSASGLGALGHLLLRLNYLGVRVCHSISISHPSRVQEGRNVCFRGHTVQHYGPYGSGARLVMHSTNSTQSP